MSSPDEPSSVRATLPPPEWTAPATAAKELVSISPRPLARRKGGSAEEAGLRARLSEATRTGDSKATRAAAIELARWLASRDRDLDEATRLMEMALEPSDDPELWRELASWLESLGEPGRAAAVLRAVAAVGEGPERAYLLIRVGVLQARAGAAKAASEAFAEAMALDTSDALAGELSGALSAWAPDAVPPAEGAEAYLEAARRRGAANAPDAQLEDIRRAVATDPSSSASARALADGLKERGKGAVIADEVWRAHAKALAPESAARVHAARTADALDVADPARALGASLDAGADAELEGDAGDAFDTLLLKIGLLELLAARLEARIERTKDPKDRARRFEELARLFAGPLADPARAAAAHVAALSADPASEDAIVSLNAQLGEAQHRLEVTGGDARLDPLRRFAAVLRDVPEESVRRGLLVAQLRAALPNEGKWSAALSELASRRGAGGATPEALVRMAAASNERVKAILLAVASERFAAGGDAFAARKAAEQACQADPNHPRALATLADAVVGQVDRPGAAALERALNVVGARAAWCAALAEALEALGEHGYAVAWTQRHVALRPGDLVAIDALIRRILRARDASRLGDALAWVLSQPQPFGSLAPLFAEALAQLADMDRDRAVILARRALDVFGPKDRGLREAMLAIADAASDDAFAAAALERWVSSSPAGVDRAELFVALADRRAKMGDRDAEARVIARAVRELGTFPMLHARVARLLGDGVSQDGELALMEARAEVLARTSVDGRGAASALRDYGAALWDLAGDRVGAIEAWMRAAKLSPGRGFATLGVDLIHFGSPELALDVLTRRMEAEERDPLTAGALAGEAARAAMSLGDPVRAFELAALALSKNPGYADALEIAERASVQASRETELSALYDSVADRALGRFGRRAAHYRGARYFEQRNNGALALRHAAQAFLAVPTEGATFVLLARAAERAGDRAQAIRTVEQVADRSVRPQQRAAWLLRAAMIAGPGEDGARRRVDVLLKAAVLSPDLGTLSLLGDAAKDFLRAAPEDKDVLQMRLVRSTKALTAKVEGPEGARMSLAFATLALDLFDDANGALESIERAMGMDADLDDYAKLTAFASVLSKADSATAVLERLMASAEKPYANVGVAALKLIAAVATQLGDAQTHGRAIVLAAERDPDDDALVLEADVVVRELGDAKLVEHLSKKVPPARRAEALHNWARERVIEGGHVEAAAALERAAELAEGDAKTDIEQALRGAYEAAGRGSEIEKRAQKEAQSGEATPAMRAERWGEIAERRETRKDLPGAIRALQEAAKLDPAPVERWSALERVAELAGDDDVRVVALTEIAYRVKDDGKIAVYKRLARAHERRNDVASAEGTWNKVLALDPDDEDADQAIEALIVTTGRYAQLVDHLARRADRLAMSSGARETLRAVRLRRAAILEQRLGRVEDACDELALLLTEWPDNSSALRYLADLYERMGEYARAAPLWRRAAALEHDRNTQDELEMRAAHASHQAGDARSAVRHVRAVLVRNPDNHDAMTLHVALSRASGDLAELGEALEALALAQASDPASRSDQLVEAAQVAARTGDAPLALSRAQKAAQIAPDRAAPQLLARGLEYRLRGAGDPSEARRTIEDLKRIRGALAPEDAALRAFLLAEALDVVQGGGAGMRELMAVQSDLGASALLAVGIAERLAAQGNHAGALPYFDTALRGSLLGLRKATAVALAAAESAVRCVQLEEALRLYELAAADPDTRYSALSRLAHLAVTQGWIARARGFFPELARMAHGEDRIRAVRELARLLASAAAEGGSQHEEAEAAYLELVDAVPDDAPLRARLLEDLEQSRRATPPAPSPRAPSIATARADFGRLSVPTPMPGSVRLSEPFPMSRPRLALADSEPPPPLAEATERPSEPPPSYREASPPPPPEARIEAGPPNALDELEAALKNATDPAHRAAARLELAEAYAMQGALAAAEPLLWDALEEGSVGAGDRLAQILAPALERTADVVRVRRMQVDLAPGDVSLLAALRGAAVADDDKVYARAVEHVLRAFDPGAGPLAPPPLAAQPEQPGIVSLLARPSQTPAGEVLATIWRDATKVFARDPVAYGITGVERVVPGQSSPLARVYDAAIRVLDTPRIPLFVLRATGALAASVAIISPPSVILTGDVREETAELRFVLGRGMSAALHPNVLVLGLAYKEATGMRRAILSAFGPPGTGGSLDHPTVRMAESFWQIIPARSQRRLQELLNAAALPEYEALAEAAHQSGRRVGLFLAGDFATAARALMSEVSLDVEALATPGGLARHCHDLPALADLLRLAVSPEYANARWHPVAPASQRGSISTSRFSIV